MNLFDDVAHQAANLLQNLNGKCPHCGATLEHKSGKKHFFDFECPTCHLHLEVTTRNNKRMVNTFIFAYMTTSFGFLLGFLVGVLIF